MPTPFLTQISLGIKDMAMFELPPSMPSEEPANKITEPIDMELSKLVNQPSTQDLKGETGKMEGIIDNGKIKHLNPDLYSSREDFVRDVEKLNPIPMNMEWGGKARTQIDEAFKAWGGREPGKRTVKIPVDKIDLVEQPLAYEMDSPKNIDKPIDVIYRNGRYALVDGRHRLAQAKFNKEKTIIAQVVGDTPLERMTSQPTSPTTAKGGEIAQYKTADEYWQKAPNDEIKKQFIKDYFEANGLKIDKITRAKKDDGWYVYHEYGMEGKGYKPAKIISQTDTETVKQVQPYKIKSDFIADDSEIMLDMTVQEGRTRAGLKEGRVKLDDFYSKLSPKKGKQLI